MMIEMHTLDDQRAARADWTWTFDCTCTAAEMREANSEDPDTQNAVDALEYGADEVFLGGGAAPYVRLRPLPS